MVLPEWYAACFVAVPRVNAMRGVPADVFTVTATLNVALSAIVSPMA